MQDTCVISSIRIKLIGATNLQSADLNGKSDPFCKLSIGPNNKWQSSTQPRTLNPVWNEEISFHFDDGSISSSCCWLVIKVLDSDLGGAIFDRLGEAVLSLQPIMEQQGLEEENGGWTGVMKLPLGRSKKEKVVSGFVEVQLSWDVVVEETTPTIALSDDVAAAGKDRMEFVEACRQIPDLLGRPPPDESLEACIQCASLGGMSGTLYVSSARLLFLAEEQIKNDDTYVVVSPKQIPWHSIMGFSQGSDKSVIVLKTVPAGEWTLLFPDDALALQLRSRVKHHLANPQLYQLPLLLESSNSSESSMLPVAEDGCGSLSSSWGFDASAEWERIGVGGKSSEIGKSWRVSSINERYELCDTYPSSLCVPNDISDATLKSAATFRSKERIPTLTWIHPVHGAALCRCAQPLTGLNDKRCAADETLLADTAKAWGNNAQLIVVDCRSKAAALANAVNGKGTEHVQHYHEAGANLIFLSIENIHVVRASFEKLHDLLAHGPTEKGYFRSLEECGWLTHINAIMKGALSCALTIHTHQRSIVVHCSDGWDRTAQITALMQLLLDPYCRTASGFVGLLDKEFCSFGHKCADRLGFGHEAPLSQEWSPILLQFLDSVHQVVTQLPNAFEFSVAFVDLIAMQLYSSSSECFRYNCDKDRTEAQTRPGPSLWERLGHRFETQPDSYSNATYEEWPLSKGPLLPLCCTQRLQIWSIFYIPREALMKQTLSEINFATSNNNYSKEDITTTTLIQSSALINVHITHTSTASPTTTTTTHKKYTVYHVVCNLNLNVIDDETTPNNTLNAIVLERRYSEFLNLDKHIKSHLNTTKDGREMMLQLPQFALLHVPYFGNMTKSIVKKRRQMLQAYLVAIVNAPPKFALLRVLEVERFFGNILSLNGM